ncbi:MAG TPA: hypothetical protein VFR97_07530 [Capillimicrobium sp.]|nr:hypothetical protein [Capillimicrobium sp.]
MTRSTLVALAAAAALLAGCGDDDARTASTAAATDTVGRVSLPASNGEELEHDADRSAEGVEGHSVCDVLRVGRVEAIVGVPRLRPEVNDSLDLSICRYHRGAINVRILLDGAADATRRYYNQLFEAYQKFNTIPSLKPHNVKGVGDDSTYGGTGAFWTTGREQLVAFKDDRIARVTVHVPGSTNAHRKAAAMDLARALFAKLPRARQG